MPRWELQEVQVQSATLAPGQRTIAHSPRFPVTVYVMEGAFTLYVEGRGQPVTAQAGEAMVEPPNVNMLATNRGSVPTRVVFFYVSDPGTPLMEPSR
jgi:quercetin dioxygenase-like cupin family protein